MNHLWLEADLLHDVDLTAAGPATVCLSGGEHPYRRPGAFTRGQLCAHFEAAVSPIAFCFGNQPRGGVFEILPVFSARFDNQRAVFNASILFPLLGVILQLFIAPTVTADVVRPFGWIG